MTPRAPFSIHSNSAGVRFEPDPLYFLLWFHLCFLFPLILSPSLPLSLAILGAVSEATPTAGIVPATEVTGTAWGSAGGAHAGQSLARDSDSG